MNTNQNSEVSRLKLEKVKRKRIKPKGKKRLSRSWQGDFFIGILLIGFGLFSAYPLVNSKFSNTIS